MSDNWYYGINGQQQGPVTKATLGQLFARGEINRQYIVWNEQLPDWLPIGDVPELRDICNTAPPPPKPSYAPPPPKPATPPFFEEMAAARAASGTHSALDQWEKRGKIFSVAVTVATVFIGVMACIMTFGNMVFFLLWLCITIGAPIGVYFTAQSAWENEVTGAVIAFVAAAVIGVIITICVFAYSHKGTTAADASSVSTAVTATVNSE